MPFGSPRKGSSSATLPWNSRRLGPGRRTDAVRSTMEAGIAMLEGRLPDARRLYADTLGRWQDLGLPTWLALCQLDIIETGALEPAERRRAADEARGFFERVGARPFIH